MKGRSVLNILATYTPHTGPAVSNITPRQLEVLKAIRTQMETGGYPPTIRELGDMLSIRSTNGVNDHLKTLSAKGFIERTSSKSRALTITATGYEITAPFFLDSPNNPAPPQSAEGELVHLGLDRVEMARVPLLGRIAAGLPIDAIEHVEETLTIDPMLLGRNAPEQCFALRVEGDSMIDDGIHDGDVVFIRKQNTANRGETVAVMVDGAATLKRYYNDGQHIRLQPANSTMDPIIIRASAARDFSILGRVVALYRYF